MTLPKRVVSMFEPMARRRGQRTGTLINRSGSWLLRYYVYGPQIDPATGKPKRDRVTLAIAKSKGPEAVGIREARRIAWDEWLSKLDQAHTRPSSAKTFLEFVNQRYRPDVIEYLKPSTQAFAESILRRHIVPILGKMALRDLTPADVQAVINLKAAEKLSPQTLTHIRNRVSAVLRHAKAHAWFFGELPTVAIRLPAMQREERKALTWAQVCQLANALPEPCATLVIFLVVTGLRIGEAMGLRWKRVNLTAASKIVEGEVLPAMSLLVRENYVMGRYQTLKTASSRRTVPIPEWLVPRLMTLRSTAELDSAVFANTKKSVPLDQHNLAARVLKDAAAAVGMGTPAVPKTKTKPRIPARSWVSWHNLRHTHSTLAEQAGISTAERMKILGHSSAAVNMGYTHPELELLRPRMEAMVNPKLLN